MQLVFTRLTDPEYSINAQVQFTEADIVNGHSKEEATFCAIYSPEFEGLKVSEQLLLLARLAELNEMAQSLGQEPGAPVLK